MLMNFFFFFYVLMKLTLKFHLRKFALKCLRRLEHPYFSRADRKMAGLLENKDLGEAMMQVSFIRVFKSQQFSSPLGLLICFST
jgi:hypothetical protein